MVGRVFQVKRWAKRWARGRPVRRVKGGWAVQAGRKRTPLQEAAHRRTVRRNPIAVYNPPAGRLIYGRVLSVEAQKTNGTYRGKRFRHSFAGDSRVAAYAMPDGSVLLRSAAGKRLWQDR